jgi:hypothetical protein
MVSGTAPGLVSTELSYLSLHEPTQLRDVISRVVFVACSVPFSVKDCFNILIRSALNALLWQTQDFRLHRCSLERVRIFKLNSSISTLESEANGAERKAKWRLVNVLKDS